MYFFPVHARFYSMVAHVKPLYRCIVSGLLLFCIASIWFFLFYTSTKNQIGIYTKEIVQLNQEYELLEKSKLSCKEHADSIQDLKSSLRSYTKGNSLSQLLQKEMLFIIDQSKTCNLIVQNCNAVEGEKKNWYLKNNIQLNLSGDLTNIKNFLQHISSGETMVRVKKILLTHSQNYDYQLSCHLRLLAPLI